MREWGYARVSDRSQSLDLQLDALRAAGLNEKMIFVDNASGARSERAGLTTLLANLQAGDRVVCWRLDRLGRSVLHLCTLLERFEREGIALRSLTEGLDTTTPSGRMLFGILAALAHYERELIIERVRAGMKSAAARNVHLGRPPRLSFPQRQHACNLRAQGQSLKQIAALFRVHPSTIHRCVTEGAEK